MASTEILINVIPAGRLLLEVNADSIHVVHLEDDESGLNGDQTRTNLFTVDMDDHSVILQVKQPHEYRVRGLG